MLVNLQNFIKKITKDSDFKNNFYLCKTFAGVVKLADTLDLGSSAARRGGSSPFTRTKYRTA